MNKIYRLPKKNDETLLSFLDENNRDITDIVKIPVVSKSDTYELQCHKNVLKYVGLYGGKLILGSYIVIDVRDGSILLVKHSVWETPKGEVIDITPFEDNRPYNIFIKFTINK